MTNDHKSGENGIINTVCEFLKEIKIPYYDRNLYDLLIKIKNKWKHCGIFSLIFVTGVIIGGILVYKTLFSCNDYFCWIESEISARVTMTVASINQEEIVEVSKEELLLSTTKSIDVTIPTESITEIVTTSSSTPTKEITTGTLTIPTKEFDIGQTTLFPTPTISSANLTSGCIHSDTWFVRRYINPEIDRNGCWKLFTEGLYSQKNILHIYKSDIQYPFWIYIPLIDNINKIRFLITINNLIGVTGWNYVIRDTSLVNFGVSSAGYEPNTKEQYLYFSNYSKNPPFDFVGYIDRNSSNHHVMDYSLKKQYEVTISLDDHEIEYFINGIDDDKFGKVSDVLESDSNYFWIGYKGAGKENLIDLAITDFSVHYSND